MAFEASDAIILESNGRFGFVDSGEDKRFPDGSDPRYPLRAGITRWNNYEDILWPYLEKIGVNSTNVDFYLGTHAHSDHIGLADKIIQRFRPKRIYTPEYSDKWITDPNRLWDNQYIYDKMIAAAQEAGREYGAALIQHLDPAAPLLPTAEHPHTASPSFDLGDLHIELMNYKEDYKRPPYVPDANLMAWGAKVSAFGQSAFLAADIENTSGDEDRLAPLIGQVDFLKLGHHGADTSNSRNFLETLRPKVAFQTGHYTYMVDEAIEVLEKLGTRWYPAKEVLDAGLSAFVVTFSPDGMQTTDLGQDVHVRIAGFGGKPARAFRDGLQVRQNGWVNSDGHWFWFERSTDAVHGRWLRRGSEYYYLRENGPMATGWVKDAGSWYYMRDNGTMATGWLNLAGAWYYLRENGAMATGWLNERGTWYHLRESGAMDTGWLKDGGTWYHLRESGAMATGWLNDRGTWYYLRESGAMATGWIKDGATWYHLEGSGAMDTGTVSIDGRRSRFSTSGAWLGYA